MSEEVVYRRMETRAEALTAIGEVIALAERELRVFDMTPAALREREFGTAARIEQLGALLRGTRANRLFIALRETQGIEGELPRLIGLLGQFSGQVAIHRTVGPAREAKDPMVLADGMHFWRKLHADHPRSVVTLHDPVAAQPFLDRFGEIWESSELALSGGILGL